MNNSLKNLLERMFCFFKSKITFYNFIYNIPKLLFLIIAYFVSFLVIVPEYSSDFWPRLINNNPNEKKISIYGTWNRIGEYNLYLRMKKAATNLNISYVGITFENTLSDNFLIQAFYTWPINLLNYFYKPDFNLAVTHYSNFLPYGYNIVYLNVPTSSLYSLRDDFYDDYKYLHDYNGYADLYSFVHNQNPILQQAMQKSSKKTEIYPVYFGDNYTDYTPANLNTSMITGTVWGCARDNLRIKKALQRLANEELLVGVGLPDLAFLRKGYLGKSSLYGPNPIIVLKELQKKYGISIALHTLEHMIEGIPTLRIAEAAAAGNLIITDKNYFVTKFFDDSVLYVDTITDEYQIYSQIKNHIEWARKNPDEAQAKAIKSYNIFSQNFTIEQHLLKLIEEVKKVKKSKSI